MTDFIVNAPTDDLQTREQMLNQLRKDKVSRKRLRVNPAYDTVTKMWFVEELNIEAPTVRQLIEKLPKGTIVENYYPNGSPPARFENNDTMTRMSMAGSAARYHVG